jgi:hypothetical protein
MFVLYKNFVRLLVRYEVCASVAQETKTQKQRFFANYLRYYMRKLITHNIKKVITQFKFQTPQLLHYCFLNTIAVCEK